MNKIIKINEDVVLIGTSEGSIREVRRSDCSNFEPQIGDEVEIFSTETTLVVTKKEPEKKEEKEPAAAALPAGGININLNNSQNIQAPVVPEYVAPAEPLHVVNKTAYVLLAIFLGGIGVHKLYAGYVGRGILYLLFCWTYIPTIIGLIEGIMAACKPADAHGRILV